MANPGHIAKLKKGVAAWNKWREENPDIRPNLSQAKLKHAALRGVNLREADLGRANLSDADLRRADLRRADLGRANLSQAILNEAILSEAILTESDLTGANLSEATLVSANLSGAHLNKAKLERAILNGAILSQTDLTGADLSQAKLSHAALREAVLKKANLSEAGLSRAELRGANLAGANLSGAYLFRAYLSEVNLRKAKLLGAVLEGVTLLDTDLTDADLTGCRVYGISAWNLKLKGAKQRNLVITPEKEPEIAVDNIEVAQFVYLLLHNEKIRDVIDTIGKKGVLLLGRFTEGRIKVLERLREKLRDLGYVPMVFNFDKPETKDFTETVRLLCGLSKFVIVDITNPRSAPLELQATVPDYMVPFAPILQKGDEENPFAMLVDLKNKHDWVLQPVIRYPTVDRLIEVLEDKIVRPAEAKFNELLARRTKQLRVETV